MRGLRVALVGSLAVTLTALLGPAGAANAAIAVSKISSDKYANTNAFHRTEVEPDTLANGSTIVSAFQVGRFASGGATNLGWATSTDGGTTWQHGFLPGTTLYARKPSTYARISDAVVGYDAKAGTWLIAGIAVDSNITGRAVVVNRSRDGLTWKPPVTVATATPSQFFDKEWIVCDNSPASPHYGNCYAEWDDEDSSNQLHMAVSSDGGKTWTASTVPFAGVIGGQPLVQPDGTVVVPIDNLFENAVESFVSTDGGASYTGPFAIASISNHVVAGNLRAPPLPSAEIDAAGKVYVVWQDCRFRTSCSANDIVLSTSTDGKAWSPVARIPTSDPTSTADAFTPGIGVDPSTSGSTARLGLAYYTYPNANCTSSTCQLSARFMSSTDGGATWSKPTSLVRAMSLPWLPLTSQGYMVADYISTSWVGGRAVPVVAKATSGSCSVSTLDSCNEFMVAPTGGLTPAAATRSLDRGSGNTTTPSSRRPSTAF